jgi:hypothetical protein
LTPPLLLLSLSLLFQSPSVSVLPGFKWLQKHNFAGLLCLLGHLPLVEDFLSLVVPQSSVERELGILRLGSLMEDLPCWRYRHAVPLQVFSSFPHFLFAFF